jgi:hypothetical protein
MASGITFSLFPIERPAHAALRSAPVVSEFILEGFLQSNVPPSIEDAQTGMIVQAVIVGIGPGVVPRCENFKGV